MSPMPSLPVSSVRAWHISRAWARDSSAQGPAISASGRSLPMVILPTVTWRASVMAHPSWGDLALSDCPPQGPADVEEQFTLSAGIVECNMAMGRVAEPVLRHVAFCRIPIAACPQCRIGHRLDVDSAVPKRRLAHEADLVPVDEHHVEQQRIGDEDGTPAQRPQPTVVAGHRIGGRARIPA